MPLKTLTEVTEPSSTLFVFTSSMNILISKYKSPQKFSAFNLVFQNCKLFTKHFYSPHYFFHETQHY